MLGDAEAVFALEVEGRDILIWDLEARGATGSSGRSWPEYSTRWRAASKSVHRGPSDFMHAVDLLPRPRVHVV